MVTLYELITLFGYANLFCFNSISFFVLLSTPSFISSYLDWNFIDLRFHYERRLNPLRSRIDCSQKQVKMLHTEIPSLPWGLWWISKTRGLFPVLTRPYSIFDLGTDLVRSAWAASDGQVVQLAVVLCPGRTRRLCPSEVKPKQNYLLQSKKHGSVGLRLFNQLLYLSTFSHRGRIPPPTTTTKQS